MTLDNDITHMERAKKGAMAMTNYPCVKGHHCLHCAFLGPLHVRYVVVQSHCISTFYTGHPPPRYKGARCSVPQIGPCCVACQVISCRVIPKVVIFLFVLTPLQADRLFVSFPSWLVHHIPVAHVSCYLFFFSFSSFLFCFFFSHVLFSRCVVWYRICLYVYSCVDIFRYTIFFGGWVFLTHISL
jgi:hypothetical protein